MYSGTSDPHALTRHPDFQGPEQPQRGLLAQSLVDGKPALNTTCTGDFCNAIASQNSFSSWFRDTLGKNATRVSSLVLSPYSDPSAGSTPEDLFQFDSGSDFFFPMDDFLSSYDHEDDPSTPNVIFGDDDRFTSGSTSTISDHNFHFTSEIRFWFEFKGGETLEFLGDDDLWVFVNNQLVVDLGGPHIPIKGSVTLNADGKASESTFFGSSYDGQYGRPDIPDVIDNIIDTNLETGNVYEIVVFHAERHTYGSNYKLTMGKFNRLKSSCESVCGDGITTADEVCDDGVNDGAYGKCAPGCEAPVLFCGDGTPNGPEACDDGTNNTPYLGADPNACAPGCKTPGYCGDGNIDSIFGEKCDRGDGNNTGGYAGCNADCTQGPRCGDGITQAVEACDNGARNGDSDCDLDCKIVAPPTTGSGFR